MNAPLARFPLALHATQNRALHNIQFLFQPVDPVVSPHPLFAPQVHIALAAQIVGGPGAEPCGVGQGVQGGWNPY